MIDKKHFSTLTILVILRLLFVVYSTNFDLMLFTKDSFHYINLSENISQSYFEQNIENYWINTFRLIGYPVFISFFRQFINLENTDNSQNFFLFLIKNIESHMSIKILFTH